MEKAYNLQGNLHVPVATWSEQSANERYKIDLIDYKLIYNVTHFREAEHHENFWTKYLSCM